MSILPYYDSSVSLEQVEQPFYKSDSLSSLFRAVNNLFKSPNMFQQLGKSNIKKMGRCLSNLKHS